MAVVVFFLILLLGITPLSAQIETDPAAPVWGQSFQVKIKSIFPRDKLFSTDQVFVTVTTSHRGLWKSSWTRAAWNGREFVAQAVLPEGCQEGRISVSTREKWMNFLHRFVPLTPSGEKPLGAMIPNSQSDLDSDPRMWWAYLEVWRLQDALGQIQAEKLLAKVQEMEKKEVSPELLRTIAFGYWVAGDSEKAFAVLSRLCTEFAGSPYAVAAFNDADYQTFKRNLDSLREKFPPLFAQMFNRAPANPYLREEPNVVSWLRKNPAIRAEAARQMFNAWIHEDPDSVEPYFILATVLSADPLALTEAEQLAGKAIELSHADRPYNTRDYLRGFAYRLRSKIRASRGNYIDALADIRMAQEYTLKYWPDDLDAEAELWKEMGYLDKAEAIGLEAYRKASLKGEAFLKALYLARGGKEEAFTDYFTAKLTEGENTPEIVHVPAPSFTMKNLDGSLVTLESLQGEIVVVNFWFTTCGPCIGELPELNQLAQEFHGQARFLAFATSLGDQVRNFLKDHTFKYEIIPEASQLTKEFEVAGYPTHILIDRQGKIIWKARGANPDNIERLRMMLKRMLAPAG